MNKRKNAFNPEYERIFKGRVRALLVEKALRTHRSTEPVNYDQTTPIELAKWFVNKVRPKISKASFITYRRALEEGIRNIWPNEPSTTEALKLLREVNAIPKALNAQTIGLRTSAGRKKRCTTNDLAVLQEVAQTSRLRFKDWAIAFLAATRLTGFRPAEWLNAEIVHNQTTSVAGIRLTVRTKTLKPGPEDIAEKLGKLPFRNIPIPLFNELDDDDLAIVRSCLDYSATFRQKLSDQLTGKASNEAISEIIQLKWKERITQIGRTLARLNEVAKEKRLVHKNYPKVTLYSARHEFAARHRHAFKHGQINEQAAEYLLAALMGHNNPLQQRGYGNAKAEEEDFEVIHSIDQLKGTALFIAKAVQTVENPTS